MNKDKEQEYQRHLKSLDKDILISLYLQKCFDTDVEKAQLQDQLSQAQKTIEIQRKLNEVLQEENLNYRYDITDTAFEQAKEMAENWEDGYKEEIRQLYKERKELCDQLALTEKALELLKYRPNYYRFVNENTETIDVDLAISKAKEMMKNE